MIDVLAIKPNDLLEVQNLAPPAHLPQPGEPGYHGETAEVMCLIVGQIFLEERSRAHQRHVADEHVVELRNLVEAPAPDRAAEPGDARIRPDLEQPRVVALVEVCNRCLFRIGAIAHRAKLVHAEAPAAESQPRMREEHRAGGVEFYEQREYGDKRREEPDADQRAGDVETSLEAKMSSLRRWHTLDTTVVAP